MDNDCVSLFNQLLLHSKQFFGVFDFVTGRTHCALIDFTKHLCLSTFEKDIMTTTTVQLVLCANDKRHEGFERVDIGFCKDVEVCAMFVFQCLLDQETIKTPFDSDSQVVGKGHLLKFDEESGSYFITTNGLATWQYLVSGITDDCQLKSDLKHPEDFDIICDSQTDRWRWIVFGRNPRRYIRLTEDVVDKIHSLCNGTTEDAEFSTSNLGMSMSLMNIDEGMCVPRL